MRKSKSSEPGSKEDGCPDAKKPFRPFEASERAKESNIKEDLDSKKPVVPKLKKVKSGKNGLDPTKRVKSSTKKSAKKNGLDINGVTGLPSHFGILDALKQPNDNGVVEAANSQEKLKYLRYFRLGTHRKRNGK